MTKLCQQSNTAIEYDINQKETKGNPPEIKKKNIIDSEEDLEEDMHIYINIGKAYDKTVVMQGNMDGRDNRVQWR